ncbi:unnamed protein product [Larinioides sclopetarius]|uniref:Uncharacterized protein n=1 Tax=Larinioides sclopetarius TaxID=280406 RepID=A0AAV1ZC22_9ARAC
MTNRMEAKMAKSSRLIFVSVSLPQSREFA